MEIHLPSEKEAQLSQLAAKVGCDADSLAQQIISNYLTEESRFAQAIAEGEVALERGEYLTHEQVGEKIDHFLRS